DVLAKLRDLFRRDLDPSDMRNRDVTCLKVLARLFYAAGTRYFPAECEGLENLPTRGQFIGVVNHSGAPLLSDARILGPWCALDRPGAVRARPARAREPRPALGPVGDGVRPLPAASLEARLQGRRTDRARARAGAGG